MFKVYITGVFMNFFDLITRNIKEIFFITLAIAQLLFCGCVSVENSNYAALKKADLLVKKVFNGEKITRAEGSFIWGTELEDTLTPKNEKYSAVGEKVSAAIAPIFKQDNVSGFLIESYLADSCHAVKYDKNKKITMDNPVGDKSVFVKILFTPPGKNGRKSYTLAIPVDTWETLMITEATLNGELIIPRHFFDQRKSTR